MQTLEELIQMIIRMIVNNETHCDYDRVCRLADEYRVLTTGEGVDLLLRRFIKRESEADFRMRAEITQAITPAIAASIKNPFYKVTRNERIKKGIKLKSKDNEARVQTMIDAFYGSARSENKGLDYWLKTRKFDLSFIDPNAWIVIEWKQPETAADIIKPYPFEISAKQALNFSVVNDEIQWLFAYMDCNYRCSIDPTKPFKQGKIYTFYGLNYTIVFEQIDDRYNKTKPIELQENQSIQKAGGGTYVVSFYQPNIGYPPAFRIGYKRDDVTDGRTFVIPWQDAMCYFQKSLKTVSELDLTMSGHVFPQKIQYAPPCQGESNERACNRGYNKDGGICGNCKGTGYMTHAAANDVIYLPFPETGTPNTEIFDLNNLLVYKSPPIELVKFQNDYIQQLKSEAHEAVFNSQMFLKKQGAGAAGSDTAQTAFEIDTNMQSIYDTLEAYTEKDSDLYKEIVRVFAILCNEKTTDIQITHNFPSDFKLKTQDMLLADLKTANDADAPSFLRDSINMDIAELVYSGDPIGLLKYRTKRRFFPFNGKSEEQVEFLMNSDQVARYEKVLFANFEAIFTEIEAENPEFYLIPEPSYTKQYEIVSTKVKEYTDAIDEEKPGIPNVTPLRFAIKNSNAAAPATPEEQTAA